jgi:hypothetical protein
MFAQNTFLCACLLALGWAEDSVPLNHVPFIMAHDAGSGYLEEHSGIVGLVVRALCIQDEYCTIYHASASIICRVVIRYYTEVVSSCDFSAI